MACVGLALAGLLALQQPDPPAPRPALAPPAAAPAGTGTRAAAEAPPVALLFARPDEPGVSVVGLDPGAPRLLDVWQLAPDRPARRLGRARSEPDGRFVAEGLLASVRGGDLVVTPAGSDPRAARAGPNVAPLPPERSVASSRPRIWREDPELVVALSGRPERLVLADPAGREIARLALPAALRPGGVWRVDLGPLGTGDVAWAAFADAAGRPSSWRSVQASPRRAASPAPAAPSPFSERSREEELAP